MKSLKLLALGAVLGGLVMAQTSCKLRIHHVAERDDLALIPEQAGILIGLNVATLRGSLLWKKVQSFSPQLPETTKSIQDFITECSFDPFTQIESLVTAFPADTTSRDYVAVARGTYNQSKLLECIKKRQPDGALSSTSYQGTTLYRHTQTDTYFAFLDERTAVAGSLPWVQKSVTLAQTSDHKQSLRLAAPFKPILDRLQAKEMVWFGATVPGVTRDKFRGDPRMGWAGTMKSLVGWLNFSTGLKADLKVDMDSAEDAAQLRTRLVSQIADARKNPRVMLAGLTAYLDGMSVETKENVFSLQINYSANQFDDLVDRVVGLLHAVEGAVSEGIGRGILSSPQMKQLGPSKP